MKYKSTQGESSYWCVYVLRYLEENVSNCDCADIKPTLVSIGHKLLEDRWSYKAIFRAEFRLPALGYFAIKMYSNITLNITFLLIAAEL